jgi:hypothetical protein
MRPVALTDQSIPTPQFFADLVNVDNAPPRLCICDAGRNLSAGAVAMYQVIPDI